MHVIVKWLVDRNKAKDEIVYQSFKDATKDFLKYLLPSTLFTFTYLIAMTFLPVSPMIAPLAAYYINIVVHSVYNISVLWARNQIEALPEGEEPGRIVKWLSQLPVASIAEERSLVSATILDRLEEISADEINVSKEGSTLPELIQSHLSHESVSRDQEANGLTIDQVAQAIRQGDPLVDPSIVESLPVIGTWFGEIDLRRLNKIDAYLNLPNPYIEIARDIWIAHCLGIISLKLARRNSFNRPGAIQKAVREQLRSKKRVKGVKNVTVSWHDAIMIRHYLNEVVSEDMGAYSSKAGQIRFMKKLVEEGKIKSIHLSNFYTALDTEWTDKMGWSKIDLPLKQAVGIRRAVEELVEDEGYKEYVGNEGQIRFVEELVEEGKIKYTHLGSFYSALESEWTDKDKLGWSVINLPLKQAVEIRRAVEELVESERYKEYVGNNGQIKFVEKLVTGGKIKSTHLGHFYSALESEWTDKDKLGWSKIDLPMEQAVEIRRAVEELVEDEGYKEYLGKAGQIRFVEELVEEGKIKSTHLSQFYTALESEWTDKDKLGWSVISLPLKQAVGIRRAVEELVEDEGYKEYVGNEGQIRFVEELVVEGKIKSTHLGSFYSALESKWTDKDKLG